MDWLVKHGKRVLRITGGVLVVIVGLVLMIPGVPGPGFIVVFAGISILAIDFVWAHRLKTKLQDQAKKVGDKFRRKSAPAETPKPPI
jgi:uncharacterized protein (TIGR02611 family)